MAISNANRAAGQQAATRAYAGLTRGGIHGPFSLLNLGGAMPDSDPKPPRSLTILVVDDEDSVREILTWMLQDAGHEVYQATDGQHALSFLNEHGPVNLVLSDVNMPRINGLELCVRVRE